MQVEAGQGNDDGDNNDDDDNDKDGDGYWGTTAPIHSTAYVPDTTTTQSTTFLPAANEMHVSVSVVCALQEHYFRDDFRCS